MPTSKKTAARTDIFISYSQKDKAWMERLKTHLKPLERDHQVTVWVDTKLRSGDKWRVEIDKALAKTRVAILLISPNFLASDFISTNELPPLLKAAEREGTIILPVLVSTSAFLFTPLKEFQATNSPDQPLDLLTEGQVNQILMQVFQRVFDIFTGPPKRQQVSPKAVVKAPSAAIKTRSTGGDRAVAKAHTSSNPMGTETTQLKKIANKNPAPSRTAPRTTKQTALIARRNGEWAVIPVHQTKIGNQLELVLRPDSATQVVFLRSCLS